MHKAPISNVQDLWKGKKDQRENLTYAQRKAIELPRAKTSEKRRGPLLAFLVPLSAAINDRELKLLPPGTKSSSP